MFRAFENKLININLFKSHNKISIEPKYLDDNVDLKLCSLKLDIPDFLKKHASTNTYSSNLLQYSLLNKYNLLILEKYGIPLIKLNPKPVEVKNNITFGCEEDFIITQNKEFTPKKIQHNDVILGLAYTGLHLANLSVFEKIYKSNPEIFYNKIWNFNSALDFMLFPSPMVDNSKILDLVWSGHIKRIITSKTNTITDLTPHIPDGLRARIYSNLWGLDSNLKDFLSITKLSSHFAYKQLNGGLCLYFVVDKSNITNICRKFNEDFKLPLINIGHIEQGNLGDRVSIDLF